MYMEKYEFWFVVGSQFLYGPEVLDTVAARAAEMAEKMNELEKSSRDFDDMTLMLAMNYGGRDDILHAAKQIAVMCGNKEIKSEDIDEGLFSGLLYTKGVPDVDLVIRPSGEKRISNFLIWQSAYAEYWFTDRLWPDFSEKDIDDAISAFAQRDRRYGGTK